MTIDLGSDGRSFEDFGTPSGSMVATH